MEHDKRKIANAAVRGKLRRALLELLQEETFSAVTVSQLIARAGVSRSSFYRNYVSLEDIVREIVDDAIADYEATLPEGPADFRDYGFILHIFKFYQKYADIILVAQRAKLSINLLEEITNYIINANGDMKSSSIDRYELYFYSGAGHSVVTQWLKDGMRESPEDMARMFCSIGGSPADTDRGASR